jgi:hypothetical protein
MEFPIQAGESSELNRECEFGASRRTTIKANFNIKKKFI